MRKIHIPAGTRFTRLTIVEEIAPYILPDGRSRRRFLCKCDCGNMSKIMLSSLRAGGSRSCGCLVAEMTGNAFRTHGKSKTSIYITWLNMHNRCTNPTNKRFKDYGARGITVCERWLTFEHFVEDMGDRPTGMTLDRKNNDLGYSKDNCRWATGIQQARNKTTNRVFTVLGVTGCMAELSQHFNIPLTTAWNRLNRGLDAERAFAPKRSRL